MFGKHNPVRPALVTLLTVSGTKHENYNQYELECMYVGRLRRSAEHKTGLSHLESDHCLERVCFLKQILKSHTAMFLLASCQNISSIIFLDLSTLYFMCRYFQNLAVACLNWCGAHFQNKLWLASGFKFAIWSVGPKALRLNKWSWVSSPKLLIFGLVSHQWSTKLLSLTYKAGKIAWLKYSC